MQIAASYMPSFLYELKAIHHIGTESLPTSGPLCVRLCAEHDHQSVLRNCKVVLSTGLLQKAEAWVRRIPPSVELSGLLSYVLDCAASTAVIHLATPSAAPACTTYLSLAATVRKLLSTECLVGSGPDCRAPWFASNASTLESAIRMFHHPRWAGSGADALRHATARSALLQLLPPYITLLQSISVRACQQHWPGIRVFALMIICPMQSLGMGDIVAYAGMPALLLGLIRALRSLASNDVFAAAAIAIQLLGTAPCQYWCGRGNALLAEARACIAMPRAAAAIQKALRQPVMLRTVHWLQTLQYQHHARLQPAGSVAQDKDSSGEDLTQHQLLCAAAATLQSADTVSLRCSGIVDQLCLHDALWHPDL